MGKTKEAEEEVEGQAIDAETSEMLESDVKKGKARKFILICKGAAIKKLIVFKKGPYNTRLQKAKKDGFRGEAVCGIVTGSGENLRFQLAGTKEVAGAMSVDAPVDSEPTKTTKLKEFLADYDLKRKPEYEIIRDVAALAKADEDEGGAPASAATATASAASASAATSTASATTATSPAQPASAGAAADAAFQAKCQQIKAVVIPKVKDAVAADPSQKAAIVELLATATAEEKQESYGKAFQALKALAETVKGALGGVNEKEKYENALPGAELMVNTLKGHAHRAVIAAEITTIEGHLKKAKEMADAGDYGDANKELAKLTTAYDGAKFDADQTFWKRLEEENLNVSFANLKLHQGIALIDAAEMKKIADDLPKLDAHIKAREWTQFETLSPLLAGKMKVHKERANRSGDYLGLRNNSLLMVQALEAHPNKDAIKDKIDAIKKLIEDAKKEYEANTNAADEVNRYTKARDLLAQVEAAYQVAKTQADAGAKTQYDMAKTAAELKIKALDTPEKQAIVGKQITAIKAQRDRAEKLAGVLEFSEAMTLLTELTKQCDEAEKLAKQALDYKQGETAADAATKNLEKDPKAAIAAVEKLHAQVKGHPQAAVVTKELEEIKKKIDKAKKLVAA